MEDEIDALFKLPLGEFTPARNALAARLKKAGEQAEADAVKGFSKPSVAAWVVNQLYWQHRKPFARLIEAGDRFRQAQSKHRHNSPELREHLEDRRNAQAALVQIANDVLQHAGYSGAQNMLRRVTTTLEALATYGSLPDAPQAGRLTADLAPPGFEMLAGLLPLSGGGASLSVRDERAPKKTAKAKDSHDAKARHDAEERRRKSTAAKAAVREAERELRTARTRAERTAAALATAAKRAKATAQRRAKAERQLAELVTDADAARESANEAEAAATKAAQASDNAERVLEEARRELDQLP
ncbi:MAG: hypothetical protein ABI640_03340 [Gammaproteobacteria bacterium]